MFLLAIIVGSGITAERLAGGNDLLSLLANAVATGGGLMALILTFGHVSGAHLNPAVSLAEAISGRLTWPRLTAYVVAQTVGGWLGVVSTHLMFGLAAFEASLHPRTGATQWFGEFVATFGLICVIRGSGRASSYAPALAVPAYIVAAYWFTASTGFANPAVTLARGFTDTFAGIRPADVPAFIAAQLSGALGAAGIWRLLESPEHAQVSTS